MEIGLVAAELATLEAALSQLRHLTCLILGCYPLTAVPEAVGQLTGLQRLLFFTTQADPAPLGLPRGPWQASLRWLGLPFETARHSVDSMRDMPYLQYLAFVDVPLLRDPIAVLEEQGAGAGGGAGQEEGGGGEGEAGIPSEQDVALWEGLWSFAASHPPLRVLGLDADTAEEIYLTMTLLDALLRLARTRPALAIHRTANGGGMPRCGAPGRQQQQLDWCRSTVRSRQDFFFLWEEFASLEGLPCLEDG